MSVEAAQESVIASDRLQSSLRGRPDWDSGSGPARKRVLVLTLLSQGAFDMVKALDSKSSTDLSAAGQLVLDALRILDSLGRRVTR